MVDPEHVFEPGQRVRIRDYEEYGSYECVVLGALLGNSGEPIGSVLVHDDGREVDDIMYQVQHDNGHLTAVWGSRLDRTVTQQLIDLRDED